MKKILQIAVNAVVSCAARGYVLSLYWWWFVAEPFGLYGMPWWQAAGVGAGLSLAVDPPRQLWSFRDAVVGVIAQCAAFLVLGALLRAVGAPR